VLIKSEDRRVLHAVVRKTTEQLRAQIRAAGVRLVVDVDPYDML
jgi:hypothetical protein